MLSKDTLVLIEDKVKQILDPLGFVLVELKYMESAGAALLRFLIDRQEGGITLGECSDLNKHIGQLMDEVNIISERYVLDVSSPGIDRDLINYNDFRRILNKKIHIFLKEKEAERLEFEGELVKLTTDGVYIITNKNEELFFSFQEIKKAKQVIK